MERHNTNIASPWFMAEMFHMSSCCIQTPQRWTSPYYPCCIYRCPWIWTQLSCSREPKKNRRELSCSATGAQWIDNSIFTWLDHKKSNTIEPAGAPPPALLRHVTHITLLRPDRVDVAYVNLTAVSIFSWWNCSRSHQRIFWSKE